MPRSTFRFLRIAGTTALLVYVLHKAGLFEPQGWHNLFGAFAHASLFLILASIGAGVLTNISSAIKWYMLSRARGLPVSLWRLWAYYMVGKFFNLVLPSSIGGDVIRMHQLGRYTGRYAEATAAVFVERFSGLATLVVLALFAVAINLDRFNLPWLTVGLGCGALAMGLICWVIIDRRPFKLMQRLVGKRLPLLDKFFIKIGKFRQAVLAYKHNPGALWWALINSLIFYFLAVINVWVSVLAFNAQISFISTLVAVPVILFIMNLPFSIGGIGLMEFAYSFTLGLFGVNPTVAISTALLMRAKTILDAGIGSFLYPLVSDGENLRGKSPQAITRHYQKYADD